MEHKQLTIKEQHVANLAANLDSIILSTSIVDKVKEAHNIELYPSASKKSLVSFISDNLNAITVLLDADIAECWPEWRWEFTDSTKMKITFVNVILGVTYILHLQSRRGSVNTFASKNTIKRTYGYEPVSNYKKTLAQLGNYIANIDLKD